MAVGVWVLGFGSTFGTLSTPSGLAGALAVAGTGGGVAYEEFIK